MIASRWGSWPSPGRIRWPAVGPAEIVAALKRNKVSINLDQVRLKGPLKELGLYTVKIHIGHEIEGELKVWVVPSVTDDEPATN